MIRAIISLVVVVIMVYFLVTAVQRYYDGQEKIKKAEEDLAIATREHEEAVQEFQEMLANPRGN